MRHAAVVGKPRLEVLELLPEDECAGAEQAVESLSQRQSKFGVLAPQVHERHVHWGRGGSLAMPENHGWG